MSVCSKFSRLYFCQILFELFYSWKSYHKKIKEGELFIETLLLLHFQPCTAVVLAIVLTI